MSDKIYMEEIKTLYEAFEESVFACLDTGYEEGLELDFMYADLSDFVADTDLGEMDCTMEMLFKKWRETRRI